MVSDDLEGRDACPTCDAGAVASGRLSPLLVLEIELAGRAPANRDGAARADPADENGEPALGCAAHPRRTAQAWVWRRAINGRHVHGQATRVAQPGMADLSAQSRAGRCRHGFVRCPDHWLQTTFTAS